MMARPHRSQPAVAPEKKEYIESQYSAFVCPIGDIVSVGSMLLLQNGDQHSRMPVISFSLGSFLLYFSYISLLKCILLFFFIDLPLVFFSLLELDSILVERGDKFSDLKLDCVL